MGGFMSDTFHFRGFEPTDEVKALAKELFHRLEGRSPSQSFQSGQLEKTREGYLGLFRVNSTVGNFKAQSQAEDPKECLQQIYSQVKDNLMKWSRSRIL